MFIKDCMIISCLLTFYEKQCLYLHIQMYSTSLVRHLMLDMLSDNIMSTKGVFQIAVI